ncbi:hypothetical protein ONS96_005035 [Cadophora gregata f. sp. sojae]|nr:hypothetical protein ONS96_005035 [Cadophora gregata f. sp. sojae]
MVRKESTRPRRAWKISRGCDFLGTAAVSGSIPSCNNPTRRDLGLGENPWIESPHPVNFNFTTVNSHSIQPTLHIQQHLSTPTTIDFMIRRIEKDDGRDYDQSTANSKSEEIKTRAVSQSRGFEWKEKGKETRDKVLD